MSIFSNLRKSRRQAKEHSAKLAEQKKQEESDRIPYKHVPTHAASDAFACAPPSWREAADRPKILEHNRRRGAMNAAGLNMCTPSMPRVGSRLSHVSYPDGNATPFVHLPRAQSYSSVYAYGTGRDVIYSMPDVSESQSSWKGKDVSRHSTCEITGVSPTPSKGYPSQEGSYTGSTSSSDELEMSNSSRNYLHAPANPTARGNSGSLVNPQAANLTAGTAIASAGPCEHIGSTPAEASAVHRLHPSHSRSASDASDKMTTTASTKPNTSSRDLRPPASMRGFSGNGSGRVGGSVPPSASWPYIQAALQAQGHSSSKASPQQLPTSTSAPLLTPSSAKPPRLVPAAQADQPQGYFDFSLDTVSMPGPGLDFGIATATPPEHSKAPNGYFASRPKERQLTTPTEQTLPGTGYFSSHKEQPIVLNGYYSQQRPNEGPVSNGYVASQRANQQYMGQDSNSAERPRYVAPPRSELVAPPASHVVHTRASSSEVQSRYSSDRYVNAFPEAISSELTSSKRKKETKEGGKFSKKSRWSFSKPSAITA